MAQYSKYIGDINCSNLRDFILGNRIANKKIALHPYTYDELAIDYKKTFGYSIIEPFTYLGVEIVIDVTKKAPIDRIMVIDGDTVVGRIRIIDLPTNQSYESIYRCGYCGAIAGPNGEKLPSWKVQEQINRLEQTNCGAESVFGDCCIETYRKHMTGEL